MPTCAQGIATAKSNFDSASFASDTIAAGVYEETSSTQAKLFACRAHYKGPYAFRLKGTAKLYLTLSPYTGASNNPPAPADSTYRGVGGDIQPLAELLASSNFFTTPDYVGDVNAAFTLSTCGSDTIKGWLVQQSKLIVTRQPINIAQGSSVTPFVPSGGSELFRPQAVQIASGETEILWGKSTLSSNGGAARSYPANGSYTPDANIQFDSSAPGFTSSKFQGYFRPTILASLQLVTTIKTGAPTSLKIRMYINGTLVRTTVSSALSRVVQYAFSIADLGDFTHVRPPDNNPADGYNGWPNPSIRFTVEPNTGSVEIASSSQVSDFVVNYPL